MRNFLVWLCAAALACAALTGAAQGKTIRKKNLPQAVRDSLAARYPQARINLCSQEQRDGQVCYELETSEDAAKRDIVYTAAGRALEIEERLDPAQLPQAARDLIRTKYQRYKIAAAERITRGADVGYEVTLRKGKEELELSFDVNGDLRVK